MCELKLSDPKANTCPIYELQTGRTFLMDRCLRFSSGLGRRAAISGQSFVGFFAGLVRTRGEVSIHCLFLATLSFVSGSIPTRVRFDLDEHRILACGRVHCCVMHVKDPGLAGGVLHWLKFSSTAETLGVHHGLTNFPLYKQTRNTAIRTYFRTASLDRGAWQAQFGSCESFEVSYFASLKGC